MVKKKYVVGCQRTLDTNGQSNVVEILVCL